MFLRSFFAYCDDIISDDTDNTGSIHKYRRRMIFLYDFVNAQPQFFLPAKDYITFLQVG